MLYEYKEDAPDESCRNKTVIYSQLLTTKNKKNYAGWLFAELGKKIEASEEDEVSKKLDMKGLPIRKSTVPKKIREEYTDVLVNDILKSPKIDLKKVITKFDDVASDVEQSLRSGSIEYLIPKNVEVFDSYKFPLREMSVRGTIVWNALNPEHQIVPPEKVSVIKLLTTKKDHPALLKLKETHPDKYNIIMKTVWNEGVENPSIDFSDKGFAVIALPKDVEEIPEYLLPLIDYNEMTISNTSAGNILLESLGIYCNSIDYL